jgi:hypothetical protein
MVATRAQKRCVAEKSNPLLQSGTLQRVFSFAGSEHWVFLAAVSSLWRDLYLKFCEKFIEESLTQRRRSSRLKTTLFSSVFASPSRVKLAHEMGLSCLNYTFFGKLAAGKYGIVEALSAAHELGM